MRKFKFVGTESNALAYGEVQPVIGLIYDEDFVFLDKTVLYWAKSNFGETNKEWQEVFEPESKPLHKDTDLGYYASLAMQGLLSNPNIENSNNVDATFDSFSKYCIEAAKELIKQLNEETK